MKNSYSSATVCSFLNSFQVWYPCFLYKQKLKPVVTFAHDDSTNRLITVAFSLTWANLNLRLQKSWPSFKEYFNMCLMTKLPK